MAQQVNWHEWETLGKRWLNNEIQIAEWQDKKFNKKQIAFLNAKEREVLFSGGMAAGKTTPFLVKLILISMMFPDNRILLGRKSRVQIEKTTLPDFMDLAPKGSYEYKVGPGIIKFGNGSEIILFGLEASASGLDTQGAIQAIKGMNLGAYFIDQLEEVEQEVVQALNARLRRKMKFSDGTVIDFQQGNMTANPANYWAFDWFKVHPRPGTLLIETSMLDNRDNLPKAYIEDQLSKPRLWVQKYVYGEWSTEFLSENTVFSQDYLNEQKMYQTDYIRKFDNIHIFYEPEEGHVYQIGVDPSESSTDPCAIVVIDKLTGKVCATFNEYVPVEKQEEIAAYLGTHYNGALVIPEATGIGAAFIRGFKLKYNNIYTRTTYGKRDEKGTDKLGFSMNHSSKAMIIENLRKLFNAHFAKVLDKRIISEMETFTYSNEAQKKGAVAQSGFHDDLLMATMLAYFDVVAVDIPEETLRKRNKDSEFKLYGTRYN